MTQLADAGIGSNVDYIGSTYPWADQQTTAVAASSAKPGDTHTVDNVMSSIQDSLTSSWDGVIHSFSDPVLAQRPTTGMKIQQFVSGNLGQLPIAGDSIQKYQQTMQNEGLATGLVADGEWTPAWQSVHSQMVNQVKSNQIAGQETGSVRTSSAAHNIFHAISPTGIFDAVSGFVKSIPQDTRDVAATIAGGATGIAYEVRHPSLGTSKGESSAIARANTAVQNALGGKTTQQKQEQDESWAHQLGVMNEFLSVYGAAGFAKGSIKAIGENVARGTLKAGAPELQRSPGLIARTLWAARTPEQRGLEQEVAPKLLGQKWVNNVPVLGRLAPLPQKAAEGWSYGVRTTLARPYQYPLVRAVGQTFGRAQIAGLALHGDAAITPGSAQSTDIESDHSADVLNAQWDAAQRKVIGFAPLDANLLQGFLHAPAGDLSGAVGGFSRQIVRAFDDSLGQRNVQQSYEHALELTDSQMLHEFDGNRAAMDTWMHQQTVGYTGDWWAHSQVSDIPELKPHTPQWENAIGALRTHFWSESLADPTFANRALAQMMDNDVNGEQLTQRIRATWQKIDDDPKAYLAKSLGDLMGGQRVMQQGHLDGHWDWLISPSDQRIVRNAKDAFDHDGNGSLRKMEQVTTPEGHTMYRPTDEPAEPAMSRRAFVAVGKRLSSQVRGHVEDARTQAAQTVDADGLSVAALRSAKQRQADVETHAASGAWHKMVAASLGKAPSEVAFDHPTVAKLKALNGRLHDHLATVGANDDAETMSAARQGTLNYHDVYTAAHGPKIPLPDDFGNQAQRLSLNPRLQGAIGMRNLKKTISMQQGMNKATLFERELAAAQAESQKLRAAATNPEDLKAARAAGDAVVNRVVQSLRKFLFENFDMASPELSAFDQQPQKLVALLRDRSQQLASDLTLDQNAPQAAKDWLAALHKAGYHPVIGQHVGHQYDGSLPNLDNIAGGRTLQRRIVEKLGLNPLGVRDQDINRAQRQAEITAVSKNLRNSDKARLATAQVNAKTIVDFVHSPGVLGQRELGHERAAKALVDNSGVNKSAVQALMASEDMNEPEALNVMKAEAARIVNPRDISANKLRAALGKTQEVTNPDGTKWTWQGLDPRIPEQKEATNLIIRGLMDAQRQPGYMMGWQAIENWGRAGFGFLGKAATSAPGSNFLTNVANWPNNIVRLRNSLRFNFNPLFAARLVTKTKLKMNLEGLQYHWNALDHLGANAAQAMRDTKRIMGDVDTEATNADLLAQKAGVWGIFHRDWTRADAVMQLKALGKSDADIKSTVNHIFKYGPEDGSGTSALERSVNTIFFPFSFEKTVMRNTGQYLLEHPGQSLILSAAINEYRKYDKNGQVGQWVHDHAPILEELNQLNAFSHGISPGEFGGINRQLLNLFLPQSWGGDHTTKTMTKFLPVLTNFNALLKSVGDQSDVLRNVGDNAVQFLTQTGHDPLTPYRPMETNAAQQYDAGKLRAQFILALGPVLQANDSAATGDKATWPVSAKLPATVSGQPINKTSISYLVKKFYPAYDPAASSERFDAEQGKIKDYINAQPPVEAALLLAFNNAATVVANHLSADDYDSATQAQVQNAYQRTAQAVSKVDPSFYKFYDTFWAWQLGPLETVPKVGS